MLGTKVFPATVDEENVQTFKLGVIFRSTQCESWLVESLSNCSNTSVLDDLRASTENIGDLVDCLWSYGAAMKMKLPQAPAAQPVAIQADPLSSTKLTQGHSSRESPSSSIVSERIPPYSISGPTPVNTSKLVEVEERYRAVSRTDSEPTNNAEIPISNEAVCDRTVTLISSGIDEAMFRAENTEYAPVVDRLAPSRGSVTWLTSGKLSRVPPDGDRRAKPGRHLTEIKTVLVGDGATGKTCLCRTYVHGYPCMEYIPTVFDNYSFELKLPEEQVRLGIFDTAGQEDYDRLRPLSYVNTDVMIVSFSIGSPASLDNVVEKWCPEVEHFVKGAHILLAGLKSDAREGRKMTGKPRNLSEEPVTYTRGVEVAKEIGASAYVECSSLKYQGVEQLFQVAAELGLEGSAWDRPERGSRSRRCTVM
jgi:small GTP-binding protein